MGAKWFETYDYGDSAAEAFRNAVNQAAHDFGHSGYTGTIAEKDNYIMVELKPDQKLRDFLDEAKDSPLFGKWCHCGCIQLPDKKYLFFGWASS